MFIGMKILSSLCNYLFTLLTILSGFLQFYVLVEVFKERKKKELKQWIFGNEGDYLFLSIINLK